MEMKVGIQTTVLHSMEVLFKLEVYHETAALGLKKFGGVVSWGVVTVKAKYSTWVSNHLFNDRYF